MRIAEIAVYTYDELKEESKLTALEELSDTNSYGEWYQPTYADAAEIGLKIHGFNEREAWGELTLHPHKVARLIVEAHGNQCETFQIAKAFMSSGSSAEQFTRSLLAAYGRLLNAEWETLSSREAVEETIRINEYEFTANGYQFFDR